VTATANASFTPTYRHSLLPCRCSPIRRHAAGDVDVDRGCPAYNGTLTIKYPTDSRQVTVSGASGAITDQPPQFNCSTGVSYSLAFSDGSGQKLRHRRRLPSPSGSHWVGPRSTPDGTAMVRPP